MHLLTALAAALASQTQTAAPANQTFATAPVVVETRRIALTPTLDGAIGSEEWDPFSNGDGVESFLQWEPKKLHIAARYPAGQDLLVSLDMKSNGWLVGKDNVEIRVRMQDGKPVVSSRLLDATAVAGPQWVNLDGFAMAAQAAANVEGNSIAVELTLEDPGVGLLPLEEGNTLSARIDAVPAASAPLEPFVPRLGGKVNVEMERATALPIGLRWKPEGSGRVLQPGDTTRIRLTFNGKNDMGIKKLELRCEGPLRDTTNMLTVPFPEFDKKNRAFVDYETKVDRSSDFGYRVLRGTLQMADGSPAVTQTSFRVAPLLEFDMPRIDQKSKDQLQTIKVPIYIKSNTPRRLDGHYTATLPAGWEFRSPGERQFIIYNSRASARRVMEIRVPAGTKGTFPIKVQAMVGERTFDQTLWLTLD
jgi:hypothetical protein